MTSYLRKYVTALASAKDYIAQWSSDHVFADEELIVPFPTIAIFDPDKHVWRVHIKAWIYLPFQPKSITDYLPSLTSFLTTKKSNEIKNEENIEKPMKNSSNDGDDLKKTNVFNEDEQNQNLQTSSKDEKVDKDKKETAAVVSKENKEVKKNNGEEENDSNSDDDDDIYEDCLEEELGQPVENPARLGLFFVGNSVKVTTKSIINGVEHLLHPSDETGFVEQDLEIADQEVISLCTKVHPDAKDKKFDYQIQIHNEKEKYDHTDGYKTFTCTIYVLARHGISVISDIDDTVKISNVLNKRSLLKHTFYSYFKPVEGMNELYQKWNEQKCQFHYVSASPWQLYPALRSFLEKYQFPMGTMNLRKFTWNLQFFHPTDAYKTETISEIIDAYPFRKYICVGDSGELDPEIYSKLYIKYPQSIVHIFIRDVCQLEKCAPTCEERFKKAFEDIPKERWTVFKHPNEVEADINQFISV